MEEGVSKYVKDGWILSAFIPIWVQVQPKDTPWNEWIIMVAIHLIIADGRLLRNNKEIDETTASYPIAGNQC